VPIQCTYQLREIPPVEGIGEISFEHHIGSLAHGFSHAGIYELFSDMHGTETEHFGFVGYAGSYADAARGKFRAARFAQVEIQTPDLVAIHPSFICISLEE
jgi:hypothetical protein